MGQIRRFALGVMAVLLMTLVSSALQSQTTHAPAALAIGEQVMLHSQVLQEDRPLMVYLPESYSVSTFRYPVLFLLDAEGDFLHTVGIVEFLSGTDQIPEVILVGIPNTLPMTPKAQSSGASGEERISFDGSFRKN
jgi:enterochelin esterase-like enzyme